MNCYGVRMQWCNRGARLRRRIISQDLEIIVLGCHDMVQLSTFEGQLSSRQLGSH